MVRDMKELRMEACVLGSYGIMAYHCWNYIVPQHITKMMHGLGHISCSKMAVCWTSSTFAFHIGESSWKARKIVHGKWASLTCSPYIHPRMDQVVQR